MKFHALPAPCAGAPVRFGCSPSNLTWRRWVWFCLLALAACLLLTAGAWAQGPSVPALPSAPVVLERLPQGLPLQGRVALLADPAGALSLQDVRGPAHAASWQYPAELLRAHGPTVWWLRIRVAQPSPNGHWLLELPTSALRDVVFYGPYSAAGAALAKPMVSGLIHPASSRPLATERNVFPVFLPQAGTYTLYLRVQSSIPQVMSPLVWQPDDYQALRKPQLLFDGTVYGVLLTLIAATAALYLAMRDPVFVFFGLMCAAAGLSLLSFNGHAALFLWPNSPWWIEHSYVIFPAIWLAACAGFARAFLSTRSHSLHVDGFLLAFAALAALSLLFGLLGYTVWAQRINELVAIFGSVCLALIAAWLWRRGFEPAPWYLLGNLVPFWAAGSVVGINWGWIDSLFLLHNALEIGLLSQSLVFAAALSARIYFVQRENAILSHRSRRLAHAAITDQLTGLHNRRGLDEIGNALLNRPGHHALVLFDLDQFKPINDTLGHEAGDWVLREVGQRLLRHSRERDLVARLGGDEFVVLIAQCPARPELDAMVERLRQTIDAPIDYGAQRLRVSASAGVALTPSDGSELYALMRAADWAMYAAKSGKKGHLFAADAPSESTQPSLPQTT